MKRKRIEDDEGDLYYAGRKIGPDEEICQLDFPNSTVGQAIFAGKCYGVSACSASGRDKRNEYVYYEGFGNPYDLMLEAIESPKWLPVSVNWAKPKIAVSSSEFFHDFMPLDTIRAEIRELIPDEYVKIYDNSYVNSKGSYGGLMKLREKMRGCCVNGKIVMDHPLPTETWTALRMLFLDMCNVGEANIPLVIDQLSVHTNTFRSSAALGGEPYDFHNQGTKGNWVHIHGLNMDWIIKQLLDGANPEDILAPWYHVMAAKAEVRSPDVDVEKVRVIFQQFMEADAVGEFITRPLTEWFRCLDWYMPGTSMMGNYYPKLLKALKHPDARRYFPDCKIETGPRCYIGLDKTSQDWNYLPEVLFFLSVARFLFFKPPENYEEFFRKLFGWETAWLVCKLIQLWGGTFWFLLGAFCSGSKLTTWEDTCESFITFLMVLSQMFVMCYLVILLTMGFAFYGDDTSVSVSVKEVEDYGGPEAFLDGLVSNGLKIGLKYKKEASQILMPEDNHQDRFYTWIEYSDGKSFMKSAGLCMLQRYMVKFDREGNPLHPDTKEFYTAIPWRPTTDYIPKIGLDPGNWKDESRPWVQWYRKAFGLLVDTAGNREAHDMITSMMVRCKENYPEQVELACSGFTWKDSHNFFKLGDLDSNLINIIPGHPKSHSAIRSLYLAVGKKRAALRAPVRNLPLRAVYETRGH